MKKILVTGLPGSGVTLITKMIAKCMEKRGFKVLIKDLSISSHLFGVFSISEMDQKIKVIDHGDIDITTNEDYSGDYDICITEATIFETNMTTAQCGAFDEIVVVGSEEINRSRGIERFIEMNDLGNIKMLVNLAYLGKFEYEKDRIDYLAFLPMNPSVLAIDRQGNEKGKILLSKMPKDFRKQIEALCDELHIESIKQSKGFFGRAAVNKKIIEKGQAHVEG